MNIHAISPYTICIYKLFPHTQFAYTSYFSIHNLHIHAISPYTICINTLFPHTQFAYTRYFPIHNLHIHAIFKYVMLVCDITPRINSIWYHPQWGLVLIHYYMFSMYCLLFLFPGWSRDTRNTRGTCKLYLKMVYTCVTYKSIALMYLIIELSDSLCRVQDLMEY